MEALADAVRFETTDKDGNIEHARLHVPEPKQHKLLLIVKDLLTLEDDEKPKLKGRAKQRAGPSGDWPWVNRSWGKLACHRSAE